LAAEAKERSKIDRILDMVEGGEDVRPGSTEIEQRTLARVGQGKFRVEVLKRWNGGCAVSGLREGDLIRASHIRPWSECTKESDRICPSNGLPLLASYDALFDRGFISFRNDGRMMVSSKLRLAYRSCFEVPRQLVRALSPEEVPFMEYHRAHVFRH
jgi:hypothetical protein